MNGKQEHLETTPPLDLDLEVTCETCYESATFHVNYDRFTAWGERRMAIQDAFAHLSAPDREYIKSRVCPSCWTDMLRPHPGR